MRKLNCIYFSADATLPWPRHWVCPWGEPQQDLQAQAKQKPPKTWGVA